jgi:hypothetical protein
MDSKTNSSKQQNDLKLKVPTFEDVEKLNAEGYNMEKSEEIGKSYMAALKDIKKLKKLVDLISEDDFSEEELKKYPIPLIKKGLHDFLGECGLIIL